MMDPVRGLAADAVWRPVLTGSVRATVGSSFDHAINLEVDESLLTLVTAAGARAPGVLVTDASAFARLPAGTGVEIEAGGIRIGSFRVETAGCHFYSCEALPVRSSDVAADPGRWRGALLEHAVPGSFVPLPSQSPFERALHRRLVLAAQHFQHALGVALSGTGSVQLDAAVGELVGLGVGLTPSGDDYLVGSLAALHHLGTAGPVVPALGAAVTAQASGTTAVSSHFLIAAASGRFHHDIARAATAALTASADVPQRFGQVATIGSTSGTDALFGLVDTLSTCLAPTALVASDLKEFPQ